jgi:HD superfamily phosphodiesterase
MEQERQNETRQADEIQKQINQAMEELDRIRNQRQSITTPEELQAAEQAIIKATDKLAALLTGLKIQQAIDSDDLKEKADQLVKAMPGGLKNQGKRLVSIQTSRGEPIKVAAQYFSRKKKKKKKK